MNFLHIDQSLMTKLHTGLINKEVDPSALPNTMQILEKADELLGRVKPDGLHATITDINVGQHFDVITHAEPVVSFLIGKETILKTCPTVGFSEDRAGLNAVLIVKNIMEKTIQPVAQQFEKNIKNIPVDGLEGFISAVSQLKIVQALKSLRK